MLKSKKFIMVSVLAMMMMFAGVTSAFAAVETEPLNDSGSTTPDFLTIGGIGFGHIGFGDSLDYWKVTISTTRSYNIQAVNQASSGPGSSFDFYLYDVTGGPFLAQSTGIGTSSIYNTNVTLTAGHTYFAVTASNSSVNATYNLFIN